MKKRYFFLLLLIGIILLGYQFYLKPLLQIYVGFSAKTVCSCHFIQNRPITDIVEEELSIASFINNEVQPQQRIVRSSFLGVERLAVFRKDLGCSLLSERTKEELPPITVHHTRQRNSNNLPTKLHRYPQLQKIIDQAFEEPYTDKAVHTRAILILKDSAIIAEQYGEGFTKDTPQMGWSMTKSVTNALVGILVKQGKLDIYQPAAIDAWKARPDDPRTAITLDHLLRMSSGLYFEEEYDKVSTVNQMLWTKADAGKVAYSQTLQYPVDSVWYYSSGTTNIIGHIIRKQFDDYQTYLSFPYRALFDKLGMQSVIMETDANGTYVGSSLMYATARDWAKFGQLYLQDGVWNGERILPEGWVTYSSTPTPTLAPYGFYGAQFWINTQQAPPADSKIPPPWEGVPKDAYYASGFEQQTILIIPSKNMVIVRLGQTLDRSAWNIGEFAAKVLEIVAE